MDYLNKVVCSVVEAGNVLFNNNIITNIIDKGAVENYATDIDLRIEEKLRKDLNRILPEAGFIGEENDTKAKFKEYTWIVDPIDGTANFVRGIPECCISVGLVKDGVPVMGVIYAPWLSDLYIAAEGEGATLNSKDIRTSNRDFRHSIHYMSAASYNKEDAEQMLGFVGSICSDIEDVRRFGSAALALANIAAGKIETYHVRKISPWDVCAGLCILTEAGGSYETFDYKDNLWTSKFDLMAANDFTNLEILKGRFSEYKESH